MLRQEVQELVALGPLPTEEDAEAEQVDRYTDLLEQVTRPATDEETRALVGLFGPDGIDSCYGVAWTLLHLIETAPGWPLEDRLQNDDNEWVQYLRLRVENARNLSSE